MMYGVLRNGKRRVSYLLAAIAATGCLGTGLFVVLADAGREDGRRSTVADAADTLLKKKKVVVLGTGWAGTSFLKQLDTTQYDVSVVAPRNCFVFTPLLPSVASGTVEARSITEPIRRIICKTDVQFYQSECAKIDAKSKRILCKHVSEMGRREADQDFTLDYDLLVVAVGASNNTFGSKGVQEYCHFLKEIEDAEKIRDCIVERFETASLPTFSSDERYVVTIACKLGFRVLGFAVATCCYNEICHDIDVSSMRICIFFFFFPTSSSFNSSDV
jgi:NADH:ubiquinone reductase (non-electrogenic)